MAAAALGLAAGISPGPLHSLILATALRKGVRPAMRVAVAPLLSDVAPVGLSLLVAVTMPAWVLRGLAVAGGLALVVMAIRSLPAPEESAGEESPGGDYLKGAAANLLNPNPWIFWLGAGAPLLSSAFGRGVGTGIAWLLVFYVGLVGVKLGLAIAVGRSRERLGPMAMRWSVVGSAVLLAGVGAWLFVGGIAGTI